MTVQCQKDPDDTLQVFLLIENRLVRESLVRLFSKRSEFSIAGQGGSTEESKVFDCACNIVVVDDLQTATLLGARQLAESEPPPRAVVLIGMEDDEESFLKAIRAGVSAYLLSDASANDVVAAVRAAARREAVCPPRLCLSLFRMVARAAPEAPTSTKQRATRGLTMRQIQLISLVAKGLTNKEIASQLNLSEFTIKNHIHRIMKEVEAGSRSGAVQAARALGYAVVA